MNDQNIMFSIFLRCLLFNSRYLTKSNYNFLFLELPILTYFHIDCITYYLNFHLHSIKVIDAFLKPAGPLTL